MLRRLSPLVLLACLALLVSFYAVRGNVALAQAPSIEASQAVRAPVGSGFSYQGRLLIGGSPTSESHDLRFSLYDAETGGTLLGTELEEDVPSTNGLFTVLLDFGADDFTGEARWLEIAVRPDESTDEADFSTLSGRQALTPAPYAVHAGSAASAPWDGLTDVPAGFADGVDDAGLDPQQVVWVARSGGDFTSVQAALDSITDAAADNPYLIKIAPGVYTEQVTLKAHVALEGAGQGKTILRWTGSNTSPSSSGGSATVRGANNADLRLLTIESVADGTGNQFAVALRNSNTSPTLIHVTVTATGGSNSNVGVFNNSSSPTLDNVTTTASGGAFSYGVYNSSSSPRMDNVTATASGGSQENYGVINNSSSPRMDNVTATASGGGFSYGVYNNSSTLTLTNVTATASGGSQQNYGVYNVSSSPTLDNVTATASGGSGTNVGVYNLASVTTIRDSALTGTQSVYRLGGTVRVANTQLVGPVAGSVICFNNYDANLDPVTCSP